MRGYAATGDRQFLKPEVRARHQIAGALAGLATLVAGDSDEVSRVADLDRLAERNSSSSLSSARRSTPLVAVREVSEPRPRSTRNTRWIRSVPPWAR